MTKKLLLVLVGLLMAYLAYQELPALRRELRIMRM